MSDGAAPTVEEIQAQAVARGWYEGVPVPIADCGVTLCPTHPLKTRLESLLAPDRRYVCATGDVDETATIRNCWPHPTWRGVTVYLVEVRGRVALRLSGTNPTAGMLMNTIAASDAWDVATEERALAKLQDLVTPRAYAMYRKIEMFLETSPRSGLTYLFRKLRPTVVLTPHKGETMQILTTLCLHPLGYYNGSWAGCMCPTDDVVAHVLMMRGSEADFWRRAEQHPAHEPAAGIF